MAAWPAAANRVWDPVKVKVAITVIRAGMGDIPSSTIGRFFYGEKDLDKMQNGLNLVRQLRAGALDGNVLKLKDGIEIDLRKDSRMNVGVMKKNLSSHSGVRTSSSRSNRPVSSGAVAYATLVTNHDDVAGVHYIDPQYIQIDPKTLGRVAPSAPPAPDNGL